MKKPEISFRVFGGSGPLSIYWTDGPYGDAIDSTSGKGVAWISPSGDTLGVEFDDVNEAKDHQVLKLTNGEIVTVDVIRGKVKVDKSGALRKHG
jgi:hypothetical protein